MAAILWPVFAHWMAAIIRLQQRNVYVVINLNIWIVQCQDYDHTQPFWMNSNHDQRMGVYKGMEPESVLSLVFPLVAKLEAGFGSNMFLKKYTWLLAFLACSLALWCKSTSAGSSYLSPSQKPQVWLFMDKLKILTNMCYATCTLSPFSVVHSSAFALFSPRIGASLTESAVKWWRSRINPVRTTISQWVKIALVTSAHQPNSYWICCILLLEAEKCPLWNWHYFDRGGLCGVHCGDAGDHWATAGGHCRFAQFVYFFVHYVWPISIKMMTHFFMFCHFQRHHHKLEVQEFHISSPSSSFTKQWHMWIFHF